MSQITCKICRRIGFSVCGRDKCAMRRKPYPPGIHGRGSRPSTSEFAVQLREKQRLRFLYRVRERQFENYVEEARSSKEGDAGEKLLEKLELRLDNVVFQAGFAKSRGVGRQLVGHGHILVNGRKVKVPSYSARIGDVISFTKRAASSPMFSEIGEFLKKYNPPGWIELNKDTREAKVVAKPPVKESSLLGGTKLIIEYYAR